MSARGVCGRPVRALQRGFGVVFACSSLLVRRCRLTLLCSVSWRMPMASVARRHVTQLAVRMSDTQPPPEADPAVATGSAGASGATDVTGAGERDADAGATTTSPSRVTRQRSDGGGSSDGNRPPRRHAGAGDASGDGAGTPRQLSRGGSGKRLAAPPSVATGRSTSASRRRRTTIGGAGVAPPSPGRTSSRRKRQSLGANEGPGARSTSRGRSRSNPRTPTPTKTGTPGRTTPSSGLRSTSSSRQRPGTAPASAHKATPRVRHSTGSMPASRTSTPRSTGRRSPSNESAAASPLTGSPAVVTPNRQPVAQNEPGNVRVVCRFRPPNRSELARSATMAVSFPESKDSDVGDLRCTCQHNCSAATNPSRPSTCVCVRR